MSKVTKLTLSVPSQILKQAKQYAKVHKTSISSIVTRLFESIYEPKRQEKLEDSARRIAVFTESSTGIISLSSRIRKSDLISDALLGKHRKR
jgi:Family of unknown function (DUF6364)